uniref:Uncharacterized protein n=1 Tax=viral metagenome TaxID=1070528 RepID=A0A6C0LK50_9ZZZZ
MNNLVIQQHNHFDFEKLSLGQPTALSNDSYFTKILYNGESLYIQTLKSKTKQGITKSGKKFFCDIVFDNNSEEAINWFEKLQDKCQQLIFAKNAEWFVGSLERNDLENAFNSILKTFKSGKYYLLKTNIKKNIQNEAIPDIMVYNENEEVLSYDKINMETEIVSILEIQGIKFTTRSFYVEVGLKQIMILDQNKLFNNCIIKTEKNVVTREPIDLEKPTLETIDLEQPEEPHLEKPTTESDHLEQPTNLDNISITHFDDNALEQNQNIVGDLDLENKEQENDLFDLEIEDLDDLKEEKNNSVPLKLKEPNKIYIDLYKEARNKAKLAKKNAILAYLEAKNIKNTFMIDNLDGEESDFDEEIAEVSESELENL